MALFQKQDSCFSSKAATACGCPAESLRLPTRLRSRGGRSAEINVRFAPPIMCRLTILGIILRNSTHLFSKCTFCISYCYYFGDFLKSTLSPFTKVLYYISIKSISIYSLAIETSNSFNIASLSISHNIFKIISAFLLITRLSIDSNCFNAKCKS